MLDDKSPILYLDVNLGRGKMSRLIIFEGDKPEVVADQFSKKNGKFNILIMNRFGHCEEGETNKSNLFPASHDLTEH